jgi:hypothetical protein
LPQIWLDLVVNRVVVSDGFDLPVYLLRRWATSLN